MIRAPGSERRRALGRATEFANKQYQKFNVAKSLLLEDRFVPNPNWKADFSAFVSVIPSFKLFPILYSKFYSSLGTGGTVLLSRSR